MVVNVDMYIGGKWIGSNNGERYTITSPTNMETIASVAKGTVEDARLAISAAEKAYESWRKMPAPKRGEILYKVVSLMKSRKNELGTIVSTEIGKVISEGKGEVQEAIDFIEYMGGEGRRLAGETVPSELPDKMGFTIRLPKGVVVCITPWNFPIAVPNWKIAAALISGNTVVFKPASNAAYTAASFVKIYEEAGLPPGVLNLVTGPGSTVGNELVTNKKVKSISLTGGVETGKEIYTKAASNLTHVHLELGGKNPILVMEDADVDLVVDGVLFGAFGTAGQRCTATSRLILHEKVFDEVINKLIARLKKFKIGDPVNPAVDMGPVSSKSQEEKVLEYIEIGKKEDAKLLYGGKKLKGGMYDKGYFIEPTIFEARHGMRITTEEIFGPVLSVIRVKNFEEAVKVANDVEFGLSSSMYTKSISYAFRAMNELESGITYINAPTIGAEIQYPFGGVKNTGNGSREAGSVAIDEFTEIKTVYVDYSQRLQKAQIDR